MGTIKRSVQLLNYIRSDDDDASGNSENEVPGYKRSTLSGVKHLCTSERKIYQSSGSQRLAREETWLKYSSCQYRSWDEMVFAGVHTDKEEPPQVLMFGSQHKHTHTTT